jgi:hypothetical protein
MPFLVCTKCRGYYQLQEGESPDDFQDKCQCGGDLEYIESMNMDSLEETALEEAENQGSQSNFQNPQNPENHGQIDNFDDENELVAADGEGGSVQPNGNNKRSLSINLFRISAVMAVMALLIISLGVITSKSDNYGVFNFNVYEKYSDEEINTFMESAFSPNDYGNSYDKVGKWNLNVVRIRVMGSPTSEDLKTLNKAINDINTNVKDFQLKIDDKNQMEPDMEIYFIPHSEFTQYSVNPSEVDGFTDWKVSTSGIYGGNSAGEIYKARVFIGIDGLSQERRSHVIVHELAHGLGLHHNTNQKSVLCINGPDLTEFSDLDKTMMRILYRKDILPYMSRNQVETILNNSRRNFF